MTMPPQVPVSLQPSPQPIPTVQQLQPQPQLSSAPPQVVQQVAAPGVPAPATSWVSAATGQPTYAPPASAQSLPMSAGQPQQVNQVMYCDG